MVPIPVWLLACAGDDKSPDGDPPPDGDADTDADADADTDADTDTAETAGTETGSPDEGPMAPAWYRMYSLYYYNLNLPSPGGGHSGVVDTGDAGFWPNNVLFAYDFGFDGDGAMVPVDAGTYGIFEPTLTVTLFTDELSSRYGFDWAYTDEWCTFEFPLVGATSPASVPAGRLWWGVTYTGGTVGGNCDTDQWMLDPRLWGDPRTDWATAADIGLAVGEPTSEVETMVGPDVGVPYLLGGSFRFGPILGPDFDDRVWGQAFEVDPATMALVLDGAYLTAIARTDLYPWP